VCAWRVFTGQSGRDLIVATETIWIGLEQPNRRSTGSVCIVGVAADLKRPGTRRIVDALIAGSSRVTVVAVADTPAWVMHWAPLSGQSPSKIEDDAAREAAAAVRQAAADLPHDIAIRHLVVRSWPDALCVVADHDLTLVVGRPRRRSDRRLFQRVMHDSCVACMPVSV
jgi:hypothetical protein